jgi:hypothetical protein
MKRFYFHYFQHVWKNVGLKKKHYKYELKAFDYFMHCWIKFPGISGVTKRVLDGFQNFVAGVLVLS